MALERFFDPLGQDRFDEIQGVFRVFVHNDVKNIRDIVNGQFE